MPSPRPRTKPWVLPCFLPSEGCRTGVCPWSPRCSPVPVLALDGANSPLGIHRGSGPGYKSPSGALWHWVAQVTRPGRPSLLLGSFDLTRSLSGGYRVAPATVDAARSATGGRAVRPQEATAQADGRKVRCESPKARIVNRPPSSFSRSRTVTSGSTRASENAIPAATPPDGGYGPLDKAALHPYAVLADRVSPVPYPASAVRTAGGAPGKDHLTDCTHGPRGDRQPFSRRDCASHPASVAGSSSARMSSSSAGSPKLGVLLPLRGSSSCVTGDPPGSNLAIPPPRRPEWA